MGVYPLVVLVFDLSSEISVSFYEMLVQVQRAGDLLALQYKLLSLLDMLVSKYSRRSI